MGLFNKWFRELKKSNEYSSFVSGRVNTFGGQLEQKGIWLQLAAISKKLGGDSYLSDGILVWGRILGWIRDKKFQDSCSKAEPSLNDIGVDSSISWRSHTVCWASSHACKIDGDFFEFGCHMGYTASLARSFVNDKFKTQHEQRKYFWFDMFSTNNGGSDKTRMIDQSCSEIAARERSRLYADVFILKGNVLETYVNNVFFSGRKIGFAHFDLNDYLVEMSVIEKATRNAEAGTVFLFDDFAMCPFHEQNKKYREFFREKGLEILELPTGQGLVIF